MRDVPLRWAGLGLLALSIVLAAMTAQRMAGVRAHAEVAVALDGVVVGKDYIPPKGDAFTTDRSSPRWEVTLEATLDDGRLSTRTFEVPESTYDETRIGDRWPVLVNPDSLADMFLTNLTDDEPLLYGLAGLIMAAGLVMLIVDQLRPSTD